MTESIETKRCRTLRRMRSLCWVLLALPLAAGASLADANLADFPRRAGETDDAPRFRRAIDADPLPLTELAECLNAQSTFVLAGQDYVRPKGDPGALLSPWYNKRVLDLSCVRAHDDLLFSPALTDELVRGFGFLLPYYDYLEAVTRREDA